VLAPCSATQVGRVGQPVHLTGEVVGNNDLSIIRYTAYQDWNVGAAELSYDLQTEAVLGDWKTLKQENSTADYRDYQFLDATKAGIQLEKCYRVIARLGGSKSTISNILCLPYSPVIFIPTAFSPNGDNLNDVYRPITFGITQYAMSIYDRYGQKVAELNQDSAGWDAADYPIGTYMITLRAKGTDSKWYNAKETVTVVR
jgi:gliding motility-associated-like protein